MIDHIYNSIYQSGRTALLHMDEVRELGIRAVLRLDHKPFFSFPPAQWAEDFTLLHLPFNDGEGVPPGYFERAMGFVHEQITAGNRILIHCQMGVSRATTMTMAYLIEYEGMSLPQAFACVKHSRPIVYPHPVLLRSLVEYYHLPYTPQQIGQTDFLGKLLLEAEQG